MVDFCLRPLSITYRLAENKHGPLCEPAAEKVSTPNSFNYTTSTFINSSNSPRTTVKMRAKRSKKYRKIMHQYELTFGFHEPYQVLGTANNASIVELWNPC
jgi:hypothetical protein